MTRWPFTKVEFRLTRSSSSTPVAVARRMQCRRETDGSIPPEHWETVRRLRPTVPVHIYPAGHGFNCDERAHYHEPSARLARERTLALFRQHVG